jgi:Ca2+-transporting ATPase
MAKLFEQHGGLTSGEAATRLKNLGPNALPESPPMPIWRRLVNQFRSPLIYILLFALVVDGLVWFIEGASGIPLEALAIALILLLNAGLGVFQEHKSESALAKLKELSTAAIWTLRDGRLSRVPVTELVPGDVVRIEAGDRVPADGNLIQAEGMMIDESVLTGESFPVDHVEKDEIFSGTLLVRGQGFLEVSRTGSESSMGKMATMLSATQAERTPLEKKLGEFGQRLARIVLALVVVIAIGGLLVEGIQHLGHVLLFAVALAVAAVPEGLPAVLTLTLALGVERMAKRKAVVRRLSAVESLGSVTVIATDKTGTLTENKMHVRELDAVHVDRALRAMVLANDADASVGAGDPMEIALLEFAASKGLDPVAIHEKYPRRDSRPFDSADKFMRVTVDEDGSPTSYLKGAPEVILARSRLSSAENQDWMEKANAYAAEGYRLLALGRREQPGDGADDVEFLGLVLLWDPPRPEVPDAIRRAQDAGVRVIMVTGDHPATAVCVARDVGIRGARVLTGPEIERMSPEDLRVAMQDVNVYARVTPEHKLRLVEALKSNGEIVAMTGDGVNDAPALKRSDVGVAMGVRGSDVSREVADLVLLDDNFATIVSAIEEGRNIYENIQKFIRFLFSTNLAEVLIVVGGALGAVILGLREATGTILLPLTAVQLLWVNIITDGPPALALGLDRDPDAMKERPRNPKEPLLDRESLQFILATGLAKALIAGIALITMPFLGFSLMEMRTAIFLHATIGQLCYAYPARRISAIPRVNWALHISVVLGIIVQLLTVLVPWLRTLLGLEPLTTQLALVVGVLVVLTWGSAEVYSRVALAMHRRRIQNVSLE